jgi:hypothetical protein
VRVDDQRTTGRRMSDAVEPETPTPEASGTASPASHWKRRGRWPKTAPIPRDQAARQGAITTLAFLVLGRERAIAFLNDEHAGLGGRPLALATESAEGHASVEAELGRMRFREPGAEDPAGARAALPG